MRFDPTNLAIIKQLRDGRKSFRLIADELELSENTIRARVARMIEEGVLDITGQVDHECLPGHTLVLVAVKLRSADLVNKGKAFCDLRGVVSVGVVTGRYDLFLVVLLNDEFGLLEFFTQELTKLIDDVQSTETFVVYKGFNMKVPYVL